MSDEKPKKISRRELLRGAGLAGAAAAMPGVLSASSLGKGVGLPVLDATEEADARGVASDSGRASASGSARAPERAPHNFTVAEFEILDALVARIIPTDELGPGAREAGVIYYIDREIGGALSAQKEAYQLGLAAVERYSRYSRGGSFVELSELEQDSLMIDLQGGSATATGAGFSGSSAQFFNMVRSHTLQGMFGDPYYGGNYEFAGWDLIRYPGVRNGLNAPDQARLEAGELAPARRSAYER